MKEGPKGVRRCGRGFSAEGPQFYAWDEDPRVAAEWGRALTRPMPPNLRRVSGHASGIDPRELPSRVLLADDDAETRNALKTALQRDGCEVVECRDGLELLENLKRSVLSGELPACDLIVSDIRMPGGSALDVLAEFLECDGLPPVILVSGFSNSRTRTRAQDLGAALVLEKPLRVSKLLAEVHRFIPASGA